MLPTTSPVKDGSSNMIRRVTKPQIREYPKNVLMLSRSMILVAQPAFALGSLLASANTRRPQNRS